MIVDLKTGTILELDEVYVARVEIDDEQILTSSVIVDIKTGTILELHDEVYVVHVDPYVEIDDEQILTSAKQFGTRLTKLIEDPKKEN